MDYSSALLSLSLSFSLEPSGVVRAITTLAALATVFLGLEHFGLLGHGFVATNDQVADDGVVVAEVVFQLGRALPLHSTFSIT